MQTAEERLAPASIGQASALRPVLCSVPGVVAESPLAERLRAAVGSDVLLVFDSHAAPMSRDWRRAVSGTALQWFDVAPVANVAPSGGDPNIVLDLFGALPPRQGIWRLTVDQVPLLQPFAALTGCHRPPFVTSLVLFEHFANRAVLGRGDAHISSRLPYRALLHRLGEVAGFVLRRALLGAPAGRAADMAEAAPLPRRAVAAERYRVATKVFADRWYGRMLSETWAVGELRCPPASLLQGQMPPATWIVPPTGDDMFADPFPWPGRPGVILCERFGHRPRLGDIVAIDPRRPQPEAVQLGLSCHLSYPFTWTEPDGRHFCVPEASAARRTIIYELHPVDGARPYCEVDAGRAIGDPTVFRHDGLYWLAYCDADLGGHDTLCLLYARNLEGPWTPHRLNPVKIDIRSARPGGSPFRVDGALFRPAQDCSRSYGGALAINRIDTCTPETYAETQVATLYPDPAGPYPDGIHTLSIDGDRLLVDGKRRKAGAAVMFRKLKARLKRGG